MTRVSDSFSLPSSSLSWLSMSACCLLSSSLNQSSSVSRRS